MGAAAQEPSPAWLPVSLAVSPPVRLLTGDPAVLVPPPRPPSDGTRLVAWPRAPVTVALRPDVPEVAPVAWLVTPETLLVGSWALLARR